MNNTSETGFAISTSDLGKRFNREWIFRKFTFSFKAGNMYAVTGPNGSGKSTLLQILWGQSLPTTGNIQYVHKQKNVQAEQVYKHLAIATPYMDLIDEFTLLEQVRFHFKVKPMRAGLDIATLIDLMYLSNARDKQIGNFSSGMRQRLKLGLAFYTEADVLFLDEPGTNLDRQAFDWYKTELTKVSPSTLIFVASNNPEEYQNAHSVINILDFK